MKTINDLNGQQCIILREIQREDLIKAGVAPSSTMLVVQNSDGTIDELFPWEITEEVDE